MFFFKKKIKIKLRGRAGLLYIDGDKKLEIDSEVLVGNNYDIVIYEDSIDLWLPPYENEAITAKEKELIKENIIKELKAYRISWQ